MLFFHGPRTTASAPPVKPLEALAVVLPVGILLLVWLMLHVMLLFACTVIVGIIVDVDSAPAVIATVDVCEPIILMLDVVLIPVDDVIPVADIDLVMLARGSTSPGQIACQEPTGVAVLDEG